MSELFKALNEFKPTQPKKFHLEFGKEKIEVSLEKYLEVTRAGIENFEYKDKQIVKKKRVPAEQKYPTLHPGEVGYQFYNEDPFWTTGHNREGFEWKIE